MRSKRGNIERHWCGDSVAPVLLLIFFVALDWEIEVSKIIAECQPKVWQRKRGRRKKNWAIVKFIVYQAYCNQERHALKTCMRMGHGIFYIFRMCDVVCCVGIFSNEQHKYKNRQNLIQLNIRLASLVYYSCRFFDVRLFPFVCFIFCEQKSSLIVRIDNWMMP